MKIRTTKDLGLICNKVRKEMGHYPSLRFFQKGGILMVGPLIFIRKGKEYVLATEC